MPKIDFYGVCNRTPDDINRCYEYNKSLWLPWVRVATEWQGDFVYRACQEPDRTPLAIVGGGPSVAEHIEELREWPGDIWAINGAFRWLKERGIKSTFFTIDPETYKHTDNPTFAHIGCDDKVLVSPRIPCEVIDHCIRVGADITYFDVHAYVTGATVAFRLAPLLGKVDVTAFGCESCYLEGGSSHIYENHPVRDRIVVECDDESFLTKPELLEQAKYLSFVIRGAPEVYKEHSGGLLGAMVRFNGDYDVTKIPRWMMEGLFIPDGAFTRCWKQLRQAALATWNAGKLAALGYFGHRSERQS